MRLGRFYFLTLFIAILALCTSPAFALEPFTASYQASAFGMSGNGKMTLTSLGAGKWQYDMSVRNQLVTLVQSTTFEEKNEQLRPLSSSDSSLVLVKNKSVKTQYNWDSNQVTWTGDVKENRRGPIALKAGDMDALLMNLAVVRDAQAGKTSMRYRLLENGKATLMNYQVTGKETINIAGKHIDTIKISQSSGKKQMILWIAPDMPVPARMLQREDGQDAYDLVMTSFK